MDTLPGGNNGDPPDGAPVARRVAFFVPGFEPLGAARHAARIARALGQAEQCWSITARPGPLEPGPDGTGEARLPVEAEGPGWRTRTDIRIMAWDRLIRAEMDRPLPLRAWRGARALAGILFDGTLARYIRAHWRYALFALYPILLLLGGTALTAGVAAGIGGWAGLGAGIALFVLLLAAAGRLLSLDFMLADWAFSMDLARGRSAAANAFTAHLAAGIAEALRTEGVDEVLVVGHSLGAVFATQAVAALPAPPDGAPHLALVGLGSSVLKIALHPAADALRRDLAALAARPALDWMDYASRRDPISFERAEAIATLGLPGRGATMESIHPRDMVDAATWRRMQLRPLWAHRQYVRGNTKRYFYDFAMMLCGPLRNVRRLRLDRVIGPDGGLRRREDAR